MAHQILQGKKGIIFGALDERSIAWKTAIAAVEAGAQIVLTNAPIALRMGKINELSKYSWLCPIFGSYYSRRPGLRVPTGTCQSNPVEGCRDQITPYHYSCVRTRAPSSHMEGQMTDIERVQQFMRVVATMPPDVRAALLVLMEWKAGRRS